MVRIALRAGVKFGVDPEYVLTEITGLEWEDFRDFSVDANRFETAKELRRLSDAINIQKA
jgi:hypothetical protein